jgi:hypothetical protein
MTPADSLTQLIRGYLPLSTQLIGTISPYQLTLSVWVECLIGKQKKPIHGESDSSHSEIEKEEENIIQNWSKTIVVCLAPFRDSGTKNYYYRSRKFRYGMGIFLVSYCVCSLFAIDTGSTGFRMNLFIVSENEFVFMCSLHVLEI